MKTLTLRTMGRWFGAGAVLALAGCSNDAGIEPSASAASLLQRAYVVSEQSDELFVVDLETLEEVATIDTHVGKVGSGVNANHMAVVSEDGRKIFISATAHDAIAVVDAIDLEVTNTIKVGAHNTHASACFDCAGRKRDELWMVNEGGAEHPGTISVIDMKTEQVVKTIEHDSFVVPHNVRFANGRAYVPSIGGNQISVIDVDSFEVVDVLLLEGEDAPGACSGDPCGFADAQVDAEGMLFAAHIETGKVMVYDTVAREHKATIAMGFQPWSVFVDELSDELGTAMMPNWGDATVSIMDRDELTEIARSREGDSESYGINYSPLAPGKAFVLNRIKESVAVIDRTTGELDERIDVGGTTETAATTADGKYLLLPISSANQFVVLDVKSRESVKRFKNVGKYPWSVTTIGGQNYCH